MLTDRHLSILEAVIRDFIESGQPVSSKQLYEKQIFNIKPATIRAELNALTENGFLVQPHTSGGRIPTDRGYRFFVERILAREALGEWRPAAHPRNLINLVDEIARELHLLGVGYGAEEKEVYKTGLDDLFYNLDLADKREAYEVASDFEHLDERINRIFEYLTVGMPTVFIGKSPITRSPHLSVIAELIDSNNARAVFMAIGPKKMNYEKVIRLFRSFNE